MWGSENPISRVLYVATVSRQRHGTHSSRIAVTDDLERPTRELGRTALERSPIWSCSGWGLPGRPRYRRRRCALTAPFQPYRTSRGSRLFHPPNRLDGTWELTKIDDLAVYSLLHFPPGHPDRELPGTLSCGARTFLPWACPPASPRCSRTQQRYHDSGRAARATTDYSASTTQLRQEATS